MCDLPPSYLMNMQKKTKTTFVCDFCSKEFKSPVHCSKHEKICSVVTADIHKLNCYIVAIVSHYHKKGYNVEIRYTDTFDNDLIVDLKLRK